MLNAGAPGCLLWCLAACPLGVWVLQGLGHGCSIRLGFGGFFLLDAGLRLLALCSVSRSSVVWGSTEGTILLCVRMLPSGSINTKCIKEIINSVNIQNI